MKEPAGRLLTGILREKVAGMSRENSTEHHAMKRLPIIGFIFAIGCMPGVLRAADWKPAAGPLKTRWAKDVSPNKALPEYPRPQMVRKDWLNLNGLWDYASSADGTDGARSSCPSASSRRCPA